MKHKNKNIDFNNFTIVITQIGAINNYIANKSNATTLLFYNIFTNCSCDKFLPVLIRIDC